MSWLAKIVAFVTIFTSSIFGGTHTAPAQAPAPTSLQANSSVHTSSGMPTENPPSVAIVTPATVASSSTSQGTDSSSPVATIDQSSLNPTSQIYTITGTAYNTNTLELGVVHSDYGGKTDYDSVKAYTAGNSGTAAFLQVQVVNNKWSQPFLTHNPNLSATLYVYDATTHALLTKASLKVTFTTLTQQNVYQSLPAGFLAPTVASIPPGFTFNPNPLLVPNLVSPGKGYSIHYLSSNGEDIFYIQSLVESPTSNYQLTVYGEPGLNGVIVDNFTYLGMPGVVMKYPEPPSNVSLALYYHDGNKWVSIMGLESSSDPYQFTPTNLIATFETFVRN